MSCFNERLKLIRKDNNLTQLELANLLGVSKSTISGYETGTYQPSFENIIRLSDIFSISVDYFYANLKQPHAEYKTDIRIPVIAQIPDNVNIAAALAGLPDVSPLAILCYRAVPHEYVRNRAEYFIFEKDTVQYIIRIGESCSNGDTVLACVNGGNADIYRCTKQNCDFTLTDAQNNKHSSDFHIIGVVIQICEDEQ